MPILWEHCAVSNDEAVKRYAYGDGNLLYSMNLMDRPTDMSNKESSFLSSLSVFFFYSPLFSKMGCFFVAQVGLNLKFSRFSVLNSWDHKHATPYPDF